MGVLISVSGPGFMSPEIKSSRQNTTVFPHYKKKYKKTNLHLHLLTSVQTPDMAIPYSTILT